MVHSMELERQFKGPMTCKEFNTRYFTDPNDWLAQEKLDGHRAICSNGKKFFSRRISKKTGFFAENTECVPHLVWDCKDVIFDGELVHPKGFSSVQSVVGSLPPKALAYQLEHGFLEYHVFDIICAGTLEERLAKLQRIKLPPGWFLEPVYPANNYKELLSRLWDEGKEGLILKRKDSIYECGKRSSNWLKLKETKTYDVIITGYKDPVYEYSGKHPEDWPYWNFSQTQYPLNPEYRTAITRPAYMGWVGSITVGLVKDGRVVEIADLKGISDDDQEYIKANREKLLGTVIEIKAQEVINQETKSLRHPRFSRWRTLDKSPESCTWDTVE